MTLRGATTKQSHDGGDYLPFGDASQVSDEIRARVAVTS